LGSAGGVAQAQRDRTTAMARTGPVTPLQAETAFRIAHL
jgi:hypothetical protein